MYIGYCYSLFNILYTLYCIPYKYVQYIPYNTGYVYVYINIFMYIFVYKLARNVSIFVSTPAHNIVYKFIEGEGENIDTLHVIALSKTKRVIFFYSWKNNYQGYGYDMCRRRYGEHYVYDMLDGV